MNYVFVDFEMDSVLREYKAERKICRMEIIEIGAVMLNESFEEISSFKRYVKPKYSEHVSSKIVELTGITDNCLMGAKNFETEINAFADWCLSMGEDIKVFAWSESDLKQVRGEIALKGISEGSSLIKVIDSWNDLQLEFDTSLCSDKSTSLVNALESLGVMFDGHMHDALDDSRNTAKLFVQMSTSDDYKKDVEFIKSCFHDESKGTGVTLGDLIDFSKFNFDFAV